MRQTKQNRSDKAQTLSFLTELTDDEAKNVMGGAVKTEDIGPPHKPQQTPGIQNGTGSMQNAWWINSLGGVGGSAGGMYQ